jgi:hypothetical protein
MPPFSWAITHSFLVLGMISNNGDHRYKVTHVSPKFVLFMFFANLRGLYSAMFDSRDNFYRSWSQIYSLRGVAKSSIFACFLPILISYIDHIFQFPGRFSTTVPTDTWFERLHENSCFSCFLHLFSWAIAHSFSIPGRFPAAVTTDTWLNGCHQKSPFSCFLPIFMGYSA